MFYLVGMTWKRGSDSNEAEVEGGYTIGGTVPGIPLFTYGRSPSYAWGNTALNPDNTDLYVEKVDGDKYYFDGQWYEFRTIREVIKRRGLDDHVQEFKFTHNGVVLYKPSKDELGFSIWFPLEFLNQNNEHTYSLRWVYTEGVPCKVYSLGKELVSNKPSLEGISKFFENQNMFPLNLNFVTRNGDIGYHMTGLFPKRKYNVGQGVYPKKGWMKEN